VAAVQDSLTEVLEVALAVRLVGAVGGVVSEPSGSAAEVPVAVLPIRSRLSTL